MLKTTLTPHACYLINERGPTKNNTAPPHLWVVSEVKVSACRALCVQLGRKGVATSGHQVPARNGAGHECCLDLRGISM